MNLFQFRDFVFFDEGYCLGYILAGLEEREPEVFALKIFLVRKIQGYKGRGGAIEEKTRGIHSTLNKSLAGEVEGEGAQSPRRSGNELDPGVTCGPIFVITDKDFASVGKYEDEARKYSSGKEHQAQGKNYLLHLPTEVIVSLSAVINKSGFRLGAFPGK